MKGWPLLRALLALGVLLLAGLPLRSLTQTRSGATAAAPFTASAPTAPATEKLTISITFTQPPETFSLKFLGEEILHAAEEPSFEASTTIDALYPPEGIDLVFDGTWPEYFRKVGANIRVARADGTQEAQAVWGKRKFSKVLTFTGREQP